ncbi:beta-lactamase [Alcanivorax sp. S71-1-4]|uniref:serine hydrolase domain-containing protein n=1 Tax=Alcanivorax sp. S71-1-4 TaxID=1177159 RepID=UPI001358E212|nr:serine hydrolase [Alcanivorax sp. S71-1-4]KAF0809073.1 beta-lactamase [Alcanivorax sp. S71-1-4]
MRLRYLILLAALVCAALLWWFRPWTSFSPHNLNNLMHPDTRVENFRHMDRIFPSVPMPASDQPVSFPRAPGPLPATFEHDGRTVSVQEFLQRSDTTGLMVLKDGVIRAEEYFQGASETSRFTSWSIAKTVVATLVAIAHGEGHIRSLDDPAKTYVPALDGKAWGEVTVRNLLRMATGIQFEELYDKPFSDIKLLFYRVFLIGTPVHDVISDLPAEGPQGERFHYISPTTQILAWVLAGAVGEPVSQYAHRALWQPLGMQDDGFWNLDNDGTELAFCCLNISVRDYAKLGQLYLQQGQWQGRQLLPAGWVHEATRRPEPWLAAGNGYPERGYGYHIWVPKDPDQEYFANGVWGQHVWISEKHNVVIVKTSVDPDFQQHMAEAISFLRAVSTEIGGP